MIRFKNIGASLSYEFQICLVEGCTEEALRLWPTESIIVDVCEKHFLILQSEAIKK